MSDEFKQLFTFLWIVLLVLVILFAITPESTPPPTNQIFTVILRSKGTNQPPWNLQIYTNGVSILNTKTGVQKFFTNDVIVIER